MKKKSKMCAIVLQKEAGMCVIGRLSGQFMFQGQSKFLS